MNKTAMINDDISRYIEIYKETYGEVISRGVAEIHLEVLMEFAEEILSSSTKLINENEDEKNGRSDKRYI